MLRRHHLYLVCHVEEWEEVAVLEEGREFFPLLRLGVDARRVVRAGVEQDNRLFRDALCRRYQWQKVALSVKSVLSAGTIGQRSDNDPHRCARRCTHTYAHTQIHTHTHVRTHTQIHTHACTHTHTHTHTRTYTHARTRIPNHKTCILAHCTHARTHLHAHFKRAIAVRKGRKGEYAPRDP